MGAFVDYLKRDRITGRLSYRRTYPPELRAFILRSPWELKVSLKTRNYDHQAAAIFSSAASEYDRVVSLARKQAEGTFDKLDEPLIRYLADGYLHDELALDEAGRWKTKIPCSIYESRRDREADWIESRELLDDYDTEGLVAYWQDWACTHATYKGYVLDPTTPEFAHLSRALGEAACKLWLALDKRIDGIFVATPSPPSRPIASRPTEQSNGSPKGAAMSLQGIAQGLMESSVDKVGQSTIEAWSTALRFFGEVHGSAEPQKITRQMVTEWLELLSQRPSSLPKAERLLALPALVAKYADRVDADRLSKKTLRQHLGSLASIWNKGQEGGFIQEDLPNPFKARKSLAGGSEDDGTEFSVAELQAIFALPIFTSGERPARGKGEVWTCNGFVPVTYLITPPWLRTRAG